jgi:hypothetical protein
MVSEFSVARWPIPLNLVLKRVKQPSGRIWQKKVSHRSLPGSRGGWDDGQHELFEGMHIVNYSLLLHY